MIDRNIEFPREFIWGSATAAHQVEGNNRDNDWWEHEHRADTNAVEPSGNACDHYHRFADDYRLLASLGHRAHRISIEWSRIEPSEGRINQREIDHYREVLESLHECGLDPWVTLHHFTSPRWLAARGGFARRENVEAFRRFVAIAARSYGDVVEHWCTINEPNVVAEMGYLHGYFPPRQRDEVLAAEVLGNFFSAHAAAAEALRAHAKLAPQIGLTLSVAAHEPLDRNSDADHAAAAAADAKSNGACFDALATGVFAYPGAEPREIDGLQAASTFVGVQYYTRCRYDGATGAGALPDFASRTISQMGWEIYPEGYAPLLERAAATGLPVYATENGVCHDDDRVRVEFIADHLAAVDDARRRGADVRGYFYWSAMDNFEWNFGYGPKFGLIEIDRATLERRPRASSRFFAEIARSGRLSPALVRSYLDH